MNPPHIELLDRLDLSGGRINEDRGGVASFAACSCAWVIDGATGITERDVVPEAPTDAARLAERFHRSFAARDPSHCAAETYFSDVIVAIEAACRAQVPHVEALPPYALPCAAAMWVCASTQALMLAWQGDCSAVVACRHGIITCGAPEDPPWEAGINEVVRQILITSAVPVGSMLRALSGPLRERRARLNQPGGYGMLGIDPRAAARLTLREIRPTDPVHIRLASDGLWRLVDPFRVYDPACTDSDHEPNRLVVVVSGRRVVRRSTTTARGEPSRWVNATVLTVFRGARALITSGMT